MSAEQAMVVDQLGNSNELFKAGRGFMAAKAIRKNGLSVSNWDQIPGSHVRGPNNTLENDGFVKPVASGSEASILAGTVSSDKATKGSGMSSSASDVANGESSVVTQRTVGNAPSLETSQTVVAQPSAYPNKQLSVERPVPDGQSQADNSAGEYGGNLGNVTVKSNDSDQITSTASDPTVGTADAIPDNSTSKRPTVPHSKDSFAFTSPVTVPLATSQEGSAGNVAVNRGNDGIKTAPTAYVGNTAGSSTTRSIDLRPHHLHQQHQQLLQQQQALLQQKQHHPMPYARGGSVGTPGLAPAAPLPSTYPISKHHVPSIQPTQANRVNMASSMMLGGSGGGASMNSTSVPTVPAIPRKHARQGPGTVTVDMRGLHHPPPDRSSNSADMKRTVLYNPPPTIPPRQHTAGSLGITIATTSSIPIIDNRPSAAAYHSMSSAVSSNSGGSVGGDGVGGLGRYASGSYMIPSPSNSHNHSNIAVVTGANKVSRSIVTSGLANEDMDVDMDMDTDVDMDVEDDHSVEPTVVLPGGSSGGVAGSLQGVDEGGGSGHSFRVGLEGNSANPNYLSPHTIHFAESPGGYSDNHPPPPPPPMGVFNNSPTVTTHHSSGAVVGGSSSGTSRPPYPPPYPP
eukprot:gene3233-3999_t